ncbi:hypothetical protein HCJ92_21800 [Streptomyces sp. ventii]|uniref:Integral membrane protein n=1 Tax=Streptomyces spiramenti TaxID=2720606 RepID=A0ABX1AV08_9ACTN|nr:hypothetical protein [Streptomyces spiramenti]NJP68850.1 hypothetical protein [Streptomyces spiramenti]
MSFLRTIRAALTTPAALTYLGGFAALLVWAISSTIAHAPGDASFAMIWPMLASLPLGLFVVPGLGEHPASVFVPMLLGALVNAVVVGWCYRTLRSER